MSRKLKSFFAGQPKDCQSECCHTTPSQQVTVRSQMKRGKFVFSKQPVDNICRVKTCRFFGKAVKAFVKHLYDEHGLTFSQHKDLPPASLQQQYIATKTNGAWMKYRKPELCFVPGCRYKHEVYLTDLVRHLNSEHKLFREEYRELLKTLSLKDFHGHCPSMVEEIEESAMEQSAKLMGKVHPQMHLELDPDNETYPTVRLVHIQFVADTLKRLTFSEREIDVEVIDNRQDEGVVILIGRKRLMTDLHRAAFLRSLEADDPWILDLKDFAWLKYKCSICTHVHTLDIVFHHARNERSPMFS